jgi:hypothetical protein
MITAEANVQGLMSTLVNFAAATGRSVASVMPEQVALFVRDVVKLTPPFESFSIRESFGKQRKTGEQAVKNDIARVFSPIEFLGIYNSDSRVGQKVRNATAKNNGDALGVLLKRSGYTPKASTAIITLDPMVHFRQRNLRGRVRRQPTRYFVLASQLKSYLKHKLEHVGMLKGGWGAAAAKYGVALPAWITRHAGGMVIEKLSGNSPNITIRNDAYGIDVQNQNDRITNEAIKRRDVAMARQIEAKLQGRF